jgi:hypothetical protein
MRLSDCVFEPEKPGMKGEGYMIAMPEQFCSRERNWLIVDYDAPLYEYYT